MFDMAATAGKHSCGSNNTDVKLPCSAISLRNSNFYWMGHPEVLTSSTQKRYEVCVMKVASLTSSQPGRTVRLNQMVEGSSSSGSTGELGGGGVAKITFIKLCYSCVSSRIKKHSDKRKRTSISAGFCCQTGSTAGRCLWTEERPVDRLM